MNNRRISRRDFLRLASINSVALTACIGISSISSANNSEQKNTLSPAPASGNDNAAAVQTPFYIPSVIRGKTAEPTQPTQPSPVGNGTVVHVHNPSAVTWDFGSTWWGDHIHQDKVDQMVDAGVQTLTGAANLAAAWRAILPNYQTGQKVVIKVNLNNGENSDTQNVIDAAIQPVNAVIRGLLAMGIPQANITVLDNSRPMHDRFLGSKCLYKNGVRYVAKTTAAGAIAATYNYANNNGQKNSIVAFTHSAISKDHKLPDALIDAHYLINMPIMKDHGISGVTLGFKNHYGTIDQVIGGNNSSLHALITAESQGYSSSYNPMIDLFKNPNIGPKTVLTIGDGLVASWGGSTNNTQPLPWNSFGDKAPCSLFFSKDPVAIDCVMHDFLDNEKPTNYYHPGRSFSDDYLKLASQTGLGVYERSNPWAPTYSKIDYHKVTQS